MANVVVVGAQWGDEGKGKIVDWLSSRPTSSCASRAATMPAIRSSSTASTYKLSLLPSGVVRPGKLSVIGNGVVVDPWHLLEEIARLRGQGVADHAREPAHRRQRHADPAAAPRARPAPRDLQRGDRRSAPPGAASARPMRTRSAAAPSASWIWPTLRHSAAQDRAPAGASQRAAPRPRHRRDRRRRAAAQLTAIAPQAAALRRHGLGPARRRSAAPASASCSRARRARCSTSTTAPIPS